MKSRITEAFIFMKVGNHAGENFDQILERKNNEFRKAGRIFWGYGGTSCHPIRHVQPFARSQLKRHTNIYLLMEMIDSHAKPDIIPATQYSEDGITWGKIPDGIEVLGSRYALILDEIKPGDLDICIADYEVGIGPSRGRVASEYIRGHVDKACLTVKPMTVNSRSREAEKKHIQYSAKILEPYAVMLR